MSKIKHIINILIKGSAGLDEQKAREVERERRIILTAITGAAAKAISTAIPLISVKFSLSYLGDELYGLWATVTSFFAMFTFADLGLGNGLQTELSRANGGDDIAYQKKLISSTYFILTIVAVVLLLIFLPLFPLFNWASVMNAESEKAIVLSGGFVLAIVCSKIFEIPMGLVQRTQNALQEGYKSYVWQIGSSLLSLGLIIVISRFDLGAVTMIWASSLTVVAVSLINMLVYFGFHKKSLAPSLKFIDLKTSRSLFTVGIEFFILSLVTSVSLSFDNYLVSKISSLADTTPYSLAYKFAHVLGIVSIMLSTPMWSANGEALARGDYEWVKKRTRTMSFLSLSFSVIGSVFIVLFANPLIGWMGKNLSVSYVILTGMCLQQVLIATINPYFMVLNADRVIKKQIVIYAIYAAVSLSLKWFLGKEFGISVIPWVGSICYAVLIVPFIYITVSKIFRNRIGEL